VHVKRIIRQLVGLIGLTLLLTFGAAAIAPSVAVAQTDGYEGEDDGYEGEDDGYQGEDDGYQGEDDGAPEESPPPATGGSSLPNTGGVALIGLAVGSAAAGLAVRRLART
jgi:hypothetical protein